MADLTMAVALLGFFSGFLGWAGLLGSANDLGKEMFLPLLGLAALMTLVCIGRAIVGWYRRRPRYSGHVEL